MEKLFCVFAALFVLNWVMFAVYINAYEEAGGNSAEMSLIEYLKDTLEITIPMNITYIVLFFIG